MKFSDRQFFSVKTVAEAREGFRPTRRTRVEEVALDEAVGRVPAAEVLARDALPGFDRSTVDGYAVRAADTYGASDGIPGYLDVAGTVQMGRAPTDEVAPATAVAIPTGGMLPRGADAVVMVEHTEVTMPGTIEVVRPVAPGENIVRADEDAAPGTPIAPPGRPLRAQDIAMLAASGVTTVAVRQRPRVTIVATGDEVVPPATPVLAPGQVRDALSLPLAALVREAGGTPRLAGIVPDESDALEQALRAAISDSDMIVVSAGSSVGGRDHTASAVAALDGAEIWCHGLALKPGKPTLLAQAGGGVPVIGLPGNPRSALVVFRLIGAPLVRAAGGWTAEHHPPSVRARLGRDLPSSTGRLDVVQVRLRGGEAEPLFGSSSLLSILTAADGYVVVPEEATGLAAGHEVEVLLHG